MWGKKRSSSNLVEHGVKDLSKKPPFVQDFIMENGIKLTIRSYHTGFEGNYDIKGYGILKILAGDVLYFLDNKLHRKNGPAFIRKDELFIWALNGVVHRDGDLPAVESNDDKLKIYFKNGLKHRLNNPAEINGNKIEYWVNGIHYEDEEKFINESRSINIKDILSNDCELEFLKVG